MKEGISHMDHRLIVAGSSFQSGQSFYVRKLAGDSSSLTMYR